MELEVPTLTEILQKSGGNEQLLKELLNKLRLWLKQQPHLPQGSADISDQRLRFLICTSKFNLERVKKRLDKHYTLRNMIPEISNRDPQSDSIIQCRKYIQILPLPKLTPGNYRLFIVRLLTSDISVFDFWTMMKYSFMTLETLVEEDIVISNIVILDTINFHMSHALKFTPSVVKRGDMFLATYARRIKAVHIINVPSAIHWLMLIVKPVINAKIFSRIHLYESGIESLYGTIPKSTLPADYGGELPSMDAIADMWYAKLVARREWFLGQEKVSANESLRPNNSVINPNDLFGVPGTFQKLDID